MLYLVCDVLSISIMLLCVVYLDCVAPSIWIEIFFVCLDCGVFSIWIVVFFLSGLGCSVYLE
jgi:hypothetical protein